MASAAVPTSALAKVFAIMLLAAPLRAYLGLAVSMMALGMAGIFANFGLTGTGAVEVTFLRLIIAVPIIIIVAAIRGQLKRLEFGDAARLIFAGAILGLHFVLWISSLCYISVALSTLLICTTPFWLALYDSYRLRRLPSRDHFIGIPLAALSVSFLVLSGPRTHTILGAQPVLGSLLALAGAGFIGAYLCLIRGAQVRHRTLTVVAYTYPGALLALTPLMVLLHEPMPRTQESWLGILLLAGLTQLIGHTALSASLRFFSATLISFICLLEPVIAAVGAAVFLAQPLSISIIGGGVVLLVAIGFILRGENAQLAAVEAAIVTP